MGINVTSSERIGIVSLAGLFLIPFIIPVHSFPITSFYSEWWAALLGLLMVVPWLFASESIKINLPRPIWIMFAFAGLILLQVILGRVVYPSQGWLSIFYLFWAILLMVATRTLAKVLGLNKILEVLAWAVVAGGVLNAIIGIFQAFSIHTIITDSFFSYGSTNAVFGNLGQANHFADYLSLAVAAVLYLGYQKRLPWLAILVIGLTLLLGLALSGSRSVWLYLASMLILTFLFHLKKPVPASRQMLWGLVLALVVFQILQMLLVVEDLNTGITTANARLQEPNHTMPIRLALWQDALRMFVSEPLLGVGFQNYAWNHFELIRTGQSLFAGESAHETIRWTHSHNIVFHLMAEFGLIALILMIGAVWWVVRFIQNVATVDHWFIAAGVAIISIHSLLEYPLWYANFLGIFAVLVALTDDRPLEVNVLSANLHRFSWFFMVLGISLLAFYYTTYAALEKALTNVTNPKRTSELNISLKQSLNTAQMNPFLEPAVDSLMSQLPVIDSAKSNFVEFQLRLNEKVIRYAADADSIYHRTTLLWLAGRHQESKSWLKEAVKIYPGSMGGYLTRMEYKFEATPELASLLEMLREMNTQKTKEQH